MVLCEVIMCKFLVIVLGYLLLGIRCTRLDKNSLGTRPPPAAFQNEPEPYFTAPIENVTVPVGREAVLICPVSDLGNFRVGWMRADDQTVLSLHTRVVSHSSRYAVTNEPGATWKLHIRPVKEQDRGCYMCQINTPTMKNQLGCLDVHTPPNILDEGTSGDVTSREGEDVALSCRAEGNPPPRILWRREGGQSIIITNTSGEIGKVDTFSGETLKLSKVVRKQMGAYLCIASNDVPPSVSKRILLTIQFPPSVVVANQLLGVSSRSSVVLECFVEAFPHTHNYWMKNHGESIVAGPNYEVSERKISPYQFRMKLKITDLTGFETGSYTCVATNQLGKADGTIRIYEIATTTTSTTTTTTTTEAPPTVQFTSTTEQQPFYHAIPLPPAEQKFLTDDTTTHSSENEIFEQSVLDSTWPTTKTHYSLSNTESLKPYCTVIVFIFTCLMS